MPRKSVTTVSEMIEAFLKKWPQAGWGPGHIALEDGNLRDRDVEWCIDLTKATLMGHTQDIHGTRGEDVKQVLDVEKWFNKADRNELWATLHFLQSLLAIPEDIRESDGEIA